jgi:predicted transcriptional regulator
MHGLGELEAVVMDILWRAGQPMKVRDVLDRIPKALAYTTIMTVLDNLHRKAWVERELVGRAYLYRPAFGREQAAARALRQVLDSSGDPEAVLMHFAQSVSEHESTVLRKALDDKQDGHGA